MRRKKISDSEMIVRLLKDRTPEDLAEMKHLIIGLLILMDNTKATTSVNIEIQKKYEMKRMEKKPDE